MRLTSLCLAVVVAAVLVRRASSDDDDTAWWLRPQRMLQTNLREIDATMDLDRYVRDVKDFGANVVLFNVGGIVANYPTELEFHYRNPHMKGDLAGAVLRRLHEQGIRMIGRFDFSKINEAFAARHPEWLYVSEKGEHVNYNGQVHTCVSGGYQQEYMLKILGEAVDRYPLDGVFFNMIGYTRRDYSGRHHGICQCDNCSRLFKEHCGLALPKTSQRGGPAHAKYGQFTRKMTDRQFRRVRDFLKKKRPDLAICTYTLEGVDVIRTESNSRLGRETYHDTQKATWRLLTAGRRQLANAAVHFIAIPYRHAAVSPYLSVRRIWQHMVNGAWLDFYCIGPLQRQEDRTGLDLVGELYRFHAANERWLQRTRSAAEVALVRRDGDEHEGLVKILLENHVAFQPARIDADDLAGCRLAVVPDARGLTAEQCAVLDAYVKKGGRLLLTGKLPRGLRCIGPVTFQETRPPEKASYVRIRPEDRRALDRPALGKLDLVFLQGEFHVYQPGAKVDGYLRLIPGDMFGPPEKCYYRKVSDHPALLHHRFGKGAAASFPFGVGAHYERQGHPGHANLVLGAVDGLLGLDRRLRVTASPLVEVTHREDPHGRFEWIALFNHTGQRGNVLHAPLPVPGIRISLRPTRQVKSARLLRRGRDLALTTSDAGRIVIELPPLDHYDVVLIRYD
jgi:hypothetical protein